MKEMATKKGQALLVFAGAVALTAYPPVAALLYMGIKGAFGYLAPDSLYYLAIANHSLDSPFFTFDGVHPTNGFHPLWLFFLERCFGFFSIAGGDQILFVAVSGIVFVSLGSGLFALALLGLTRRPALALVGAVPGIFYLALPRFHPTHFSQWSFVNGMETPLSVLLYGLLVYLIFGREWLRPPHNAKALAGLSLILSLIVLARLDDVFILLPFGLYVALSSDSRRAATGRVAIFMAIPVLAIAGYLAFNLSYAESALPSSGTAKFRPLWALARNGYALLTTVAPFIDILGRGNIAWSGEAWRMSQMLIPPLAGFWWLATRPMSLVPSPGSSQGWENCMVGLLAGYVVIKSGYNFAMVSLWDQGEWYYPLTIMTFNLIVTLAFARLLDSRRASNPGGQTAGGQIQSEKTALGTLRIRWPQLAGLPLAGILAFMLILVTANRFSDGKMSGRSMGQSYAFWVDREAIGEELSTRCPGCGVVAFEDGLVSYSLEGISTLNGLGLVLDREAAGAQEAGDLLGLAWRRGYRFFVSVSYAMPAEAYSSREKLRAHLLQNRHLGDEQLDQWRFEVAFTHPGSGASFIAFEPRGEARAKSGNAL